MDKAEIRLRCLECARVRCVDPFDTMKTAEAFYDWIHKFSEPEKPQYAHENKKLAHEKKSDTPRILP